jgi:hypothetical protein
MTSIEEKKKKIVRRASAAIPPVVRMDKLVMALMALDNNKFETAAPAGAAAGSKAARSIVVYDPDVLRSLRGMFPAGRTYDFEMHNVLALSTDGGGSLLAPGVLSLSPSVTTYAEWTGLAALFDEAKAISTSLEVVTAIWNPAAVAFLNAWTALDEVDLSTAPASTLAVIRIAGSRGFTMSGESGSFVHHHRQKVGRRDYCLTGTPFSQSPVGGLIGCWKFGNGVAGTATTQYFTVVLRTIARFRARQ